MNIEILREYITFAKHLNYTVAASVLNMSQPGLSRHVAELESAAGAELVSRRGRSLYLTPAGKLMLRRAEEIVFLYDGALADCRGLSGKPEPCLTVARSLITDRASRALMGAFHQLCTDHPDNDLQVRGMGGVSLFRALDKGAVDVGLFRTFDAGLETLVLHDARRYVVRPVAELEPFVWMETSNPLASHEAIAPRDLTGVAVSVPANDEFEAERMMAYSFFARTGVVPRYSYKPVSSIEEFGMSRLDGGVYILTEHLDPLSLSSQREGMVTRRFSDPALHVAVYLVSRTDDENPLIDEFAGAFCQVWGREPTKDSCT